MVDPSATDAAQAIFDLTGGKGADVAFIDVGISAVINQALQMMKKGGTCVLFAGAAHGSTVTLDPNWIHYREINFIGSSASSPKYHQVVLNLAAAGKLDIAVSHVLALDEWKTGFDMKANAEGNKAVIRF